MEKYQIEWLELKEVDTARGRKKLAKVSLKKADGTIENNVTIWDTFPGFADLGAGSEVTGTLETKESSNGYVNTTLKAPSSRPTSYAKPQAKAVEIGVAMERKEKSIAKFQDSKELGMRISAAQRDAVLIATSFYPEIANAENDKEEKISGVIEYWRHYLYSRSDKPPF
jgi:hypothetical protein